MKARLTDISVRRLKLPAKGQATFWDAQFKGFGVRCSQAGAKAYVLKSQNQLTTLGRVGIISLAQARAKAKRVLAEKTLGLDQAPTITVCEAKDLFLAAYETRIRPRTLSEYKRLLKHLTAFDKRSLGALLPHDLAETIDKLRKTPVEQNHAFATARTFFRFCVRRGLIARSPLEGMNLPSRITTRDRVLSDEELSAVFKTAAQIGYPFGFVVLLLILTGQRKGEIASLEWTWIDKNEQTITIPASIAKNRRQHTFPYGRSVADVLAAIPADSPQLFSVYNWDKRTGELREAAAIDHFVLHDLRRTYASGMAALGIPPHVVEKLLNHITGTVSGVAAVYNRYRYADEMRAAVTAWEARLQTLVAS